MIKDYSKLVTDEWDFGKDRVLAKQLRDLVLAGKKTATTDLYREGMKVPSAGDYAAILDSDGKRVCIVRYTEVEVKPFLEVDAAYARLEGEDYTDIEVWRDQHRQFFKTEYGPFDDSFKVVCERFELVQKVA